jgi:hypothetical protein
LFVGRVERVIDVRRQATHRKVIRRTRALPLHNVLTVRPVYQSQVVGWLFLQLVQWRTLPDTMFVKPEGLTLRISGRLLSDPIG